MAIRSSAKGVPSFNDNASLRSIPVSTLSDLQDDDLPPPTYGDSYGKLSGEKDGLGTTAYTTEDGRVNIRINQLNRRLSQVFIPALREEVQNTQDTSPPPPPYIPESLGGHDGVPPPPMSIVIHIVGSRGDVQPFVALGKVLKNTYGHRVRLATHPVFKKFVLENGLEFFSIGGDPSRLMAFMVKNPSLMPSFRSVADGDIKQQRKIVSQYIQGCWRSCYEAGDGMGCMPSDDDMPAASDHDHREARPKPFVADCIVANPPSFAHVHCAEKLGCPLHIMFTMPYSATQAFPHPLANIQSNADPHLTNYMSYAMMELLSWQGLGDIINRFRAKCLGLDPISRMWAPGMLQRLKVPHTYCWSPALVNKPKDWGPHINIAGFYLLDSVSYEPPPDLKAFLAGGPTPIYIGFGSIVLEDPAAMTKLVLEAARITGQRVLLSRGWGDIGGDNIPDNIFLLGNVPHDWLFKHVSCVVHHGGAGTTAAGISAGRSTVVVPFFGDQPFWGSMIARAGAGPDPIPFKLLTAAKLATAIEICLKPESLNRAKELAQKIASENGVHTGAQSFHQFLGVDRLRCTLIPSQTAAWRVRRTKVRLSTLAACTLVNANLLDPKDLKLFRAQEYETDRGATDPISGPFFAACGAFSSMAMGLADVPSETAKALKMPFRSTQRTHDLDTDPSHSSDEVQISTNRSDHESIRSHNQASNAQPESPRRHANDVQASESPRDQDMLRQSFPHSSKGAGRFAKALVQSPMDLSMTITRGFHNMPKLWNDDTVRPSTKVSDFSSGARAAGKNFGLGWYDGVTGLVTQPWRGAQKDGAVGFVKGIGKGMGGFVAKSGAGSVGILGYTMKGLHKEVQLLFASNVDSHIAASRTSQGYEEWLQCSEAEKRDVIDKWKLIQKYLKRKGRDEEMIRDLLAARAKSDHRDEVGEPTMRFTRTESNETTSQISERSSSFAASTPRTSENSLRAISSTGHEHRCNNHISLTDAESDASLQQTFHSPAALSLAQDQAAFNQDSTRQDQDFDDEAAETERYIENLAKRSMAPSRRRLGTYLHSAHQSSRSGDCSRRDFGDERTIYQPDAKTLEEKTEEDIVLEYVKKQSLLETLHHERNPNRAGQSTVEAEDEALRRAIELSLQEQNSGTLASARG
ncbi:hypothetical protein CKM354_000222100 [Cercospora kikuchii]|uniref:Glycosyltransferase family 28 N-terminal domain-containing protein n=1 Tax=Cercospora kikuchii TaxID=84275 RepID=A0A9P3FDR5_9PEZI|nr:uncharacterized protein CKM354_000222100 [Cercospora kikuchii]GIZ38820.1 hypothetical protein CKM354_000222100 [Cercospora kikuchii]